ncbi:MAG: ATP-binding protein [Planctomycetia bacterium]|jgi:serine/threonine-protein kinase RsbW
MQQDALAPWRRELDLPSERGASRQIMDELLEQLDRHGWSATDKFGIHLAAEEAIVNAILHGNRLDPRKRVHVICTISPDLFRIDITDEGDGFDPALVPDCTQEDRLTVPSGRGVMLMRSFMTRIEYNAKGNRVVLEKTPSPEAA